MSQLNYLDIPIDPESVFFGERMTKLRSKNAKRVLEMFLPLNGND